MAELSRGDAVLLAGTARVTITPPVGTHLQGYNRGRPSEGVRDELYARALVLERGKTRAALVCADVIGLELGSVARARALAEAATGIPAPAICIATSHTHSGPAVLHVGRADPRDEEYTRVLERWLAGAVALASGNTRPVQVAFGEGSCDFNVNRRLPTPDGIVMRPYPEGSQDRRVQVLRLDAAEESPTAILFRYACHPTCLTATNLRISADYPGAASRAIERLYGAETHAFFLPGCFGDLRPWLTTADGNFRGATDAEVERLGRRLGAEVTRVSETAASAAAADLSVGRAGVTLPYAELPSRDALDAALAAAGMEAFAPHVHARREKGEWCGEVQALRLGPVTLVALPGEVVHEIGRAIERELPAPVVTMGYTNATPGYLCTARQMAEGGYEPTCFLTSYHHPAPFTRDTEERLRDAALRAVRSME